ncbi:MAG: HdeD family acid-resistance protein [bacterium]|nr:HdeD family acid-resistance protein [bacterium]
MSQPAFGPTTLRNLLHDHWGWLLALGIVQMIAGVLAVGAPVIATVAVAVFLGWLFIFSGVFQLIHAFRVRGWQGFALHVLGGVIYAVAGLVLVGTPMQGALTLTLLLAIFFVIEGVLRCMQALRLRPGHHWGWFLLGGLSGIVLGVLIFSEWPTSGTWAIGLMVGINLILSGSTLASLAMTVRKAPTGAPDAAPVHP